MMQHSSTLTTTPRGIVRNVSYSDVTDQHVSLCNSLIFATFFCMVSFSRGDAHICIESYNMAVLARLCIWVLWERTVPFHAAGLPSVQHRYLSKGEGKVSYDLASVLPEKVRERGWTHSTASETSTPDFEFGVFLHQLLRQG